VNRPHLILITGPSGVGKNTLSHALGRRIGCPVISRDEIKEGMVVNAPDFASAPGDPLTVRTFDVSFDARGCCSTPGSLSSARRRSRITSGARV
jgi:hypothetical protein